MNDSEGVQTCPICGKSTNSSGKSLVSDHAVACHIAAKGKTGDRLHKSWALGKSPMTNFKASVPQIADIIEWAVVEARKERIQTVLKDQKIRSPYEKIAAIERKVHGFIEITLKKEIGNSEQEWWVKGIPEKIRIDCQTLCEKDKRKQPPYCYTYLINLKEILDYNWKIFEKHHTQIVKQCKSKKDFLDAFHKLNDIRNTFYHPTRELENLPEEDSLFLDWFDKTTTEFVSVK
jgi:hypothetical protein